MPSKAKLVVDFSSPPPQEKKNKKTESFIRAHLSDNSSGWLERREMEHGRARRRTVMEGAAERVEEEM